MNNEEVIVGELSNVTAELSDTLNVGAAIPNPVEKAYRYYEDKKGLPESLPSKWSVGNPLPQKDEKRVNEELGKMLLSGKVEEFRRRVQENKEFQKFFEFCEKHRKESGKNTQEWMRRLAMLDTNLWALYMPENPPVSVFEPLMQRKNTPPVVYDVMFAFCADMNPQVPPFGQKEIFFDHTGTQERILSPKVSFFKLAVKYGLTSIVDDWFARSSRSDKFDIDANEYYYCPEKDAAVPLIWVAALAGDIPTMKVLLKNGARLDKPASMNMANCLREPPKNYYLLKPFVDAAIKEGHKDLILVQKELQKFN